MTDRDDDWKLDGACSDYPTDWWFPDNQSKKTKTDTAKAIAICDACLVREECLAYALEHDERFGIWGGVSQRERRSMRRELHWPGYKPIDHGTAAGYNQHLRRHDPVCQPCRDARNRQQADNRLRVIAGGAA